MRRHAATIALAAAVLATPAVALAARRPTRTEAGKMAAVIGVHPASQAHCLLQRVSTLNSAYAAEEFNGRLAMKKSCERWASNGIAVLKRQPSGRYKAIFEGSSFACKDVHAPAAVKRDLAIPGCGTRPGGVRKNFW